MTEINEQRTKKPPQAHGVLVLHKPKGPTSARCISYIKRLGQKKIGHAGTLDPMAEGVLLVLLGHATKISGYLDGKKIYSGTLRIGQQSDTWDAEGEISAENAWDYVNENDVSQIIIDWQGKSEQDVPPYSAAKHKGQPLYKLARAGKETPKKTKIIEISHAEVLNISLPHASFRVECSTGTYIRSLAHSLGTRLGCGALLTQLTREYSFPLGLDKAHTLEEIMENPMDLQSMVVPINQALPHWATLTLTKEEEAKLRNGIAINYRAAQIQDYSQELSIVENKAILLAESGKALALAELATLNNVPVWKILRGLWTEN